jgi:hypothetical protein
MFAESLGVDMKQYNGPWDSVYCPQKEEEESEEIPIDEEKVDEIPKEEQVDEIPIDEEQVDEIPIEEQ